MSISNALNNASTGLSTISKLADTVSNNVSNALTPGFGRRVTEVSSLQIGGYGSGVRVVGTTRTENVVVTSERRQIDANVGAARTLSDTHSRLGAVLGEPDAAGALASRATAFETKLMAAVAQPQSLTQLTDATTSARLLAQTLKSVHDETVQIRTEADAEIDRQVKQINDALHSVRDLNEKIVELSIRGEDVNGLLDERNRVIDSVSSVVPLRTVKRDYDQIAIYTANGGVLLDGRVFDLVFDRGPTIVTSDMTVGAELSGLRQNQIDPTGPVPVSVGTGGGLFDGGSLGALFETRDQIMPQFGNEIDLYAQDLIDRFRTLAPAAALDANGDGLFVDSDPGALSGLAGRIGLNAQVDPGQGGASWRLRDGLQAAAPGERGFGQYLQALADAMSAQRVPTGFVSQNSANSAAIIASEITSFFAGKSARADDAQAFLTSRQNVLAETELSTTGVDTDRELQALMVVEQAYAANAKVLSAIDEMMKILLER